MLRVILKSTLASVLALAALSAALAAGTAKEALQAAAAAAQKWQADAVLTHVSTLSGRADGTANGWLYTFYSPKAKKSAIVTAKNGKVTDVTADVRNTSVDPVGADFVDSDNAAEAAIRAGLKIDKKTNEVGYGLVVGNQAVGKPRLFWSVTLMGEDAISSVTLDGKTGAFVKRDDQKLK